VIDEDGEVDDEADPMGSYLKTMQELEKTCCEILDSFGYDGSKFRIDLLARKNEKRMKERTHQPHTRERQDAITHVTTQGGLFLKTGGSTMNSDDYFIACERADNKLSKIEELKEKKKQSADASQRHAKAFKILESGKLDSLYTSDELNDLIAWKTGKPCPSKLSGKPARRKRWEELKDSMAAGAGDMAWMDADEQALKQLEDGIADTPLEETRLGQKKEETKQLLFASIPAMTEEERATLRTLLAEGQQNDDGNNDATTGSEMI
jgi:hypothetical protein